MEDTNTVERTTRSPEAQSSEIGDFKSDPSLKQEAVNVSFDFLAEFSKIVRHDRLEAGYFLYFCRV
ncbi:hypothetical protein KDA_38270 [Dictyobacter alpinus]|uniref:Uncharacterized protein n=1 Tax=Dictyobacter alpinus TaxID=2014873 RepID=A0A402BAC8_9CHLR|nr:hypothetical protein KDA_38270 [Dictyobacter alpinus]